MSKRLATAAVRVLLPLLALCACATRARGADDYTAFVYAGCSQARYDAGTQYAADVDTALSALTNSAGYTAYANYTSPPAAAPGLCYARFWSNAGTGDNNGGGVGGSIGGGGNGINGGGGAVGGGNGYAYGFVPHTYSDHDESGKTLAIIIGLVAAVALVIVFLSFIRRAGGVGGKS
uniref:Gnk2-homologous domain-containing protein n=1 Tax=Oryza brachyantha TaxID=4533 RepID=J3MD00_ORYBR